MKEAVEYSLIFTKKGLLKFISHLDLLHLFQRVLRRANIAVLYSQGFHPIPKIKFNRALKLGVESDNEQLFIRLKEDIEESRLKKEINKQLPDEIQIVSATKV
ncbi:MAG: TIGR03936 family radical SAM-associated protein [Candidatus Kaelpia imicola]|nr:TIGR03936 family radical SAM-associated protein [Candidatus Kaelpia imicola]